MTRRLKPTAKWLRQKYVVEQLSLTVVAKLCGWGRMWVKRQLRKMDIPIRSQAEAGVVGRPSAEWLYQKYVVEGLTQMEVGVLCDYKHRTITHFLKKANIPIRSPFERAQNRRKRTGQSLLDNSAELRRLYIDAEYSTGDIAEMTGCAKRTVSKQLRLHGIPVRTSEKARTTLRFRKKVSGANHPARKSKSEKRRAPGFTKKLKRQIRARDNHRCVVCGARRWIRRLAVHHRNFNRDDHRPENLVTLCASCHAKVHGGSLTLQD